MVCGCPGTMIRDFRKKEIPSDNKVTDDFRSELRQWPIQLGLVPPNAPFLQEADLLIGADCVGYANPNLHSELIRGKAVAIGCPKLDDINKHKEKIKSIIETNDLNTITVAIMEVPCCANLYKITEEALDETGKRITLKKVVIGVGGKIKRGD